MYDLLLRGGTVVVSGVVAMEGHRFTGARAGVVLRS